MSESTARHERRAIRRAIGPELVSFTTDTAQAIQILQAGIQTQADTAAYHDGLLQGLLSRVAAESDYAEARHMEALTYIGNVSQTLHAFKTLTFWQRLRWLLTGRL